MRGFKSANANLAESVLDLVYPPKCALCGIVGNPPICSVCAGEFSLFDTDLEERGALEPLNSLARLYRYHGRAEQAVTRLKYSRVTSLAAPMARLIRNFVGHLNLFEYDYFVPVPIHSSRRRFRGFNQSELLCEALPSEKVRPEMLSRIRATASQAGLSPEERRQNLQGAFLASEKAHGARIVVIDDVFTSGNTALECARALKEKGSLEVVAVTFAGG